MPFVLLGTRRFLPIFLVQFLGAFNDQVYQKAFVALVTYRLAERSGMSVAMLGVVASGLFILPFAVLTPTAGQIADRVDKARMIRWVKAWEVVLMALGGAAFFAESIPLLFAVLFLMGAQSAVFAPVKYAVLPQYLGAGELMAGNGLVQGSTFLAIILGTIAGNELILAPGGTWFVSALVLAVAAGGLAAALRALPAPPAPGARPAVDWVFPRAIWRLIAMVRRNREAWATVRAIAWFWFLGAAFLSLLPAYAKEVLGADQEVLTVLLTAFSVGVALGAMAAVRLSRGEVSPRWPPLGALGIALLAVEFWLATPETPATPMMDRAAFFAEPGAWRILADFALIAAAAGLYVTPLNALLQVEAEAARRGEYIAASNVVDAAAIVGSAVICGGLVAAGLGPGDVLALLPLTGLVVALAIARRTPLSPLGRLASAVWPGRP